MAWFTKRNTAASILPPVTPPQTIHNHAAGHGWEIIAGVACGLVVAWIVLQWLEARLGVNGAVLLLVGTPALWFASWIVGTMIDKFFSNYNELRRITKEAEVRIAQLQLQAHSDAVTSNRALDDDAKMAQLALKALQRAYNDFDTNRRPYRANDKRPWSRSMALGYKVPGVGQTEADNLVTWLKDNGLITSDGQLNLYRYRDFTAAVRYLNDYFAPPIQVNRGGSPFYQETTSIIDNVK